MDQLVKPHGSDSLNPLTKPVHTVSIRPFLIASTECTQEAWDRVGGSDERRARGKS